MPTSVNGCGTMYYGGRKFRSDGSYITTKFFAMFFIPIVPIHTVRVIPDPQNTWVPFSKNYYMILEKRWPHPVQVLLVYLCAAAVAGIGILFFAWFRPLFKQNASRLDFEWVEIVLFALFLTVPLLVAGWLRKRARTHITV